MPENNPLVEAFKYLFTGSPQYGAGLFSPQNIRNAMGRTGQEIQTIMTPTPPPPVDLDPIRVFGQKQAQTTPIPLPSGIDVSKLRQDFVNKQGERQPINWQAIADIGIPALSALIGSVAPGTLPAAAGISTGYTGAREKQRQEKTEAEKEQKKMEFELEKERTKKQYEITDLTPSERNYKRKQQKDYLEAYAQNNSNRRFIEEARKSLDNLPGGVSGSINLQYKKYFDPDSPVLGDWQKVKAILTDTTLLQSMKTKGAISDREMEEFKQSAANDMISKPRIIAAFDRYKQILDSEDEGKLDAFYASFGEDPRKGYRLDEEQFRSMSDYSDLSDEEIDARIQELEGRQ